MGNARDILSQLSRLTGARQGLPTEERTAVKLNAADERLMKRLPPTGGEK